MGDLKWFLGIHITRDHANQKVYLTQDSYINKIIKDYSLSDRPHIYTPLSKDSASAYTPYKGKATTEEIKIFQHHIGSIILWHNSKASYTTNSIIEGFSDTAFADDLNTHHSSEGYLFKLFGGRVEWRAIHQDTVTTSTTEAELLALSHTGTQVYWWQQFFKQLGFNPGHCLSLQTDNQMAAGICTKTKPSISTKLKHVDIHQHWLQECVQDRSLDISWISTVHAR
uniref:Reverse transcriptase Ty1/copia-type domain-containing protein n=1 Tax=Coccidioides posadasii RMSCC 3488 TaxID=454284 RepID=A0A0J6FHN7_COCPO|nr:hypothetical protein CPAG_05213 [Coccidioides posadasii RMSCC 3488]